jgi:hypothetical protein
MKKIIAEDLIDIVVQTVYLHLSDTWLSGLYKGATFIGVVWNYKDVDIKPLVKAADELFPKNLNDLASFEKKFSDRVTYHPVPAESYFNLDNVNLERVPG